MKIILVLIAISSLVGIEGVGRKGTKDRRQLPFLEEPDASEDPLPTIDIQKIESHHQDFRRNNTEVSTAKNLDDPEAVSAGDLEAPLPAASNASRQFYPGWYQTPSYPSSAPPSFGTSPNVPQSVPILPQGCLAPRGQYPSLNNCANYLNCWDEIVIEETCPNGLLFNDVSGLCDFEYNVNCGSRPGPTPKPSLPPGARRCPDLNGRYRSSTNCSEFYVCLSGSPIKFACPPGLVYNDVVNVCDYVYNVDCQGAATPAPLALPPRQETFSPATSGLQRPVQTQVIQHPQGVQPAFPPNAYPDNSWQSRNAEADWHQGSSQPEMNMKEEAISGHVSDESVESEPTETPTVQSPWDLMHSVPEELSKVPCENGSVYRLNESCSSVIVCRNERPQLVQCPQGLTYDTPSDSCRHASTAKC